MNEALTHHGILGMKWGVRNDPGKGGRAKPTHVGNNPPNKKSMSTGTKVAIGVVVGSLATLALVKLNAVKSSDVAKGKESIEKILDLTSKAKESAMKSAATESIKKHFKEDISSIKKTMAESVKVEKGGLKSDASRVKRVVENFGDMKFDDLNADLLKSNAAMLEKFKNLF